MKKWTTREVRDGASVSPDSVNVELHAQQSAITTLDREQLATNFVDEARLQNYALHRVWHSPRFPTGDGEQQLQAADADTAGRAWLAVNAYNSPGAWFSADYGNPPISLDGFKGGNLFVEWSGNAYVFPPFADTGDLPYPKNPKYLSFRIVINGLVVAERRGVSTHEHFRIFGAQNFPPGPLTMELQLQVTGVGPNDPLEDVNNDDPPLGHAYGLKYLVVGRFR